MSPAFHGRSKQEIKAFALSERRNGNYYDLPDAARDEVFRGSIDRFSGTAQAFRASRSILDAGSGHGPLPALLKMLGHEVYEVDFNVDGDDSLYRRHDISFSICNVEADSHPFETEYFDAVCSYQVFEHFTYSHLSIRYQAAVGRLVRFSG